MTTHTLPANKTKTFILAGKATFTLESSKTGKRYTYKVNSKKDGSSTTYFVKLLTGKDNETDYTYMAYFRENLDLNLSSKSKYHYDSEPFKVME